MSATTTTTVQHGEDDRWSAPAEAPMMFYVRCLCGETGISPVGFIDARKDLDLKHTTRHVNRKRVA